MGASASRSNSVFVFVDQGFYRPGDTVSGNICINIIDPTTRYTELCLQVEGSEETRWMSRFSETETVRTHHVSLDSDSECVGRSTFLSVSVPLDLMSQSLDKPGQFRYPFTFKLPSGIPPSFSLGRSGSIQAKIQYKLIGILSKDRTMRDWAGRVRHSATLNVRSPKLHAAHPREMSNEGVVASWLGCCLGCCPGLGHGRVRVRAVVESSTLAPGSMTGVHAFIENASSRPVVCKLALKRHMTLIATASDAAHRDSTTVWSSREGPVPAGTFIPHHVTSVLHLPATSPGEKPLVTVNSELIRCYYALHCTVVPVGSCCGADVGVSVPVEMLSGDLNEPDWSAPTAPLGWNPHVMDSQFVPVPDSWGSMSPPPVSRMAMYPSPSAPPPEEMVKVKDMGLESFTRKSSHPRLSANNGLFPPVDTAYHSFGRSSEDEASSPLLLRSQSRGAVFDDSAGGITSLSML